MCLAFLSQLGLPSSAHDFLLVTLLTTMPISISSVSSIFTRVLAPGNSLRKPKAHSTGLHLASCIPSTSTILTFSACLSINHILIILIDTRITTYSNLHLLTISILFNKMQMQMQINANKCKPSMTMAKLSTGIYNNYIYYIIKT